MAFCIVCKSEGKNVRGMHDIVLGYKTMRVRFYACSQHKRLDLAQNDQLELQLNNLHLAVIKAYT